MWLIEVKQAAPYNILRRSVCNWHFNDNHISGVADIAFRIANTCDIAEGLKYLSRILYSKCGGRGAVKASGCNFFFRYNAKALNEPLSEHPAARPASV